MPKIPQGNFNTRSAPVGRQQVTAPKVSGIDRALDAGANLIGAAAKLADQKERTEAFAAATEVQRIHKEKKVQYETALSTVNGKGEYSYVDPAMDLNDPTNLDPKTKQPKRTTGKIFDLYKELKTGYDQGVEFTSSLTRGDIAKDLIDQNVGDDLLRLSTKQSKAIVRQQVSETTNTIKTSIDSAIDIFSSKDLFSSAPVKDVGLKVSSVVNNVKRNLATASPVIGAEGARKQGQYLDAKLETGAYDVLKQGVNANSVAYADEMVKNITDPVKRSVASRKVESVKKRAAEYSGKDLVRKATRAQNTVNESTHMTPEDEQVYLEAAKSLTTAYVDPNYSSVTREDLDERAEDLVATVQAKKLLQESLGDPDLYKKLGFSGNSSREPAEALTKGVSESITSSQLADFLKTSPDFIGNVSAKTIQKAKGMYGNLKKNTGSMVQAQNPELSGEELFDRTTDVANAQGFGDVPLVNDKQGAHFRKDFKETLATNPQEAWKHFAGLVQNGGETYKRAQIIDLVGKDKSLEYLVAASDLSEPDSFKAVENDANFAANMDILKAKKISTSKINQAYQANPVARLDSLTSTSHTRGMKQLVINEAVAIAAKTGDIKKAMETARENLAETHTLRTSPDGRSSILAVKRKGSPDYSEHKEVIDRGMQEAVMLPNLNKAQKTAILQQYVRKIGDTVKKGTSEYAIDQELKHSLSLRPSSRWGNKTEVVYQGVTITLKDDEIIYDTDELMEFGKQKKIRTTKENLRVSNLMDNRKL